MSFISKINPVKLLGAMLAPNPKQNDLLGNKFVKDNIVDPKRAGTYDASGDFIPDWGANFNRWIVRSLSLGWQTLVYGILGANIYYVTNTEQGGTEINGPPYCCAKGDTHLQYGGSVEDYWTLDKFTWPYNNAFTYTHTPISGWFKWQLYMVAYGLSSGRKVMAILRLLFSNPYISFYLGPSIFMPLGLFAPIVCCGAGSWIGFYKMFEYIYPLNNMNPDAIKSNLELNSALYSGGASTIFAATAASIIILGGVTMPLGGPVLACCTCCFAMLIFFIGVSIVMTILGIVIYAIGQGNANAFMANYFASTFLYYGTILFYPIMVKNGMKRTFNTLLGHSTGLFLIWSLLVLAFPTSKYFGPSAAAGGFVVWLFLLFAGKLTFAPNTFIV